jgi:hypothetical protein
MSTNKYVTIQGLGESFFRVYRGCDFVMTKTEKNEVIWYVEGLTIQEIDICAALSLPGFPDLL